MALATSFTPTQKRALAIATVLAIVTTISVYLAVFKGVPIDEPEDENQPKAPGPGARFVARAREKLWTQRDQKRRQAAAATPSAAP